MKQANKTVLLILVIFLLALQAETAPARDSPDALRYLVAATDAKSARQASAPAAANKKSVNSGKTEKNASATKSGSTAKGSSKDKAASSAQGAKKSSRSKTGSSAQSAKKKQKTTAKSSSRGKKRAALPPASAELPQSGTASWVGHNFHGRPVAMGGETYDLQSLTVAHRALPFNTLLKVTMLENGRSVLVRVNDRGPYIKGRIADLALGAAEYLGYASRGLTQVRIEYAGRHGDPGMRYYLRLNKPGDGGAHSFISGLGPFESFDDAAQLLLALHPRYPDMEILALSNES